jgi:glycosyltransferase involved in cell wall biosynthesis
VKILLITSLFPPYVFGGAEVAIYNMVKLLVARGHDVHVATVFENDAEPAWRTQTSEGYTLYRLRMPRSHTLYGRQHEKRLLKKAAWHVQDHMDPRNLAPIDDLLHSVSPDHIDVHNVSGFGFNALPALDHGDASVAYILHDFGLACFHGTMFKDGDNCGSQCVKCRVISFLRQQSLSKIKRLGFISPSISTIQKLQSFVPLIGKAPSLVLRNASDDLPALPKRTTSAVLRLVYVGRLDPIKGITFLLDVLSGLAGAYAFHLLVLGTGPLEHNLRAKYSDANWVTFRGYVPSEEVHRCLAESDLYCMPSIWEETYGMTTAQSLTTGTPVIGSAIGGTKELVRDGVTGVLLRPNDQLEWRTAFTNIFIKPEQLLEWRANAMRFAYEFDNNHIATAYELFIRSL